MFYITSKTTLTQRFLIYYEFYITTVRNKKPSGKTPKAKSPADIRAVKKEISIAQKNNRYVKTDEVSAGEYKPYEKVYEAYEKVYKAYEKVYKAYEKVYKAYEKVYEAYGKVYETYAEEDKSPTARINYSGQ